MIRKESILLAFLFLPWAVDAQSVNEDAGMSHAVEFAPYHRVCVVLSHAYVSPAVVDGDRKWLAVPAFGLDYDYWFHRKWGIGIHTDLIIEDFFIESEAHDEGYLERRRPFAAVATIGFKPERHLTCMVGAGNEFEPEEHLFLIRFGMEYGYEVNEKWEVSASLMYDAKVDAYDTWVLGLGVSRLFRTRAD